MHWRITAFILFSFYSLFGQVTHPYLQIEHHLGSYQFEQAKLALEELPDSLKEEELYHSYRAQIARARGDLQEARSAYEAWIALDSNSLKAYLAWAQVESQAHNYPKAAKLYLSLIARDSLNPYFYKLLAYLELKRESSIGALIAFEKVLELNPKDQEAAAQLSKLYLDLEQFQLADSLLQGHLVLDSMSRPLNRLYLQSAFLQKQYPEAAKRAAFSLKELGDSSLAILRMSGIANYHIQEWSVATDLLLKALDSSSDKEQILFYLGMIHIAREEHQKGQAYLKLAMQEGTSKAMAVYQLNLALSYDETAKYQKAIPLYQAVWESSQSPLMLYYLARAYDQYYADKGPAKDHYQLFLNSAGDDYYRYQDYSRKRIAELKRQEHFKAP